MNYFTHAVLLKRNNPYRAWRIYQVVFQSSLKFYARKIYGSRYEDALGMAYRHILENFDDNKGDLEHYATTVIKTIDLGRYRHEVDHDEVVLINSDMKAFEENNGDPLDIVIEKEAGEVSTEVTDCVAYLLPFFISDYRLFKLKKSADRTLSYSGLYDKFSDATVAEAVSYLVDNFSKEMDELTKIRKSLKFRNYSEDRYKKSMDTSVQYICETKGVIIYKKDKGKTNKHFYGVDLQELITDIIKYFYHGKLNRNICGLEAYCSLSGKIICDIDELYDTLENEVVGSIVSRFQILKVVRYEKNKELLLISSKILQMQSIAFEIYDKQFSIPIVLRSSKCIDGN